MNNIPCETKQLSTKAKQVKQISNLTYKNLFSHTDKKKSIILCSVYVNWRQIWWLLQFNRLADFKNCLKLTIFELIGTNNSDLVIPINQSSKLGKFIKEFFEKGTRNRHSYIQRVRVKNIWQIKKGSKFGSLFR